MSSLCHPISDNIRFLSTETNRTDYQRCSRKIRSSTQSNMYTINSHYWCKNNRTRSSSFSNEYFQLNETSLFGSYVCRARNILGVNHAEFVLKGQRILLRIITLIIGIFSRSYSSIKACQTYNRISFFIDLIQLNSIWIRHSIM